MIFRIQFSQVRIQTWDFCFLGNLNTPLNGLLIMTSFQRGIQSGRKTNNFKVEKPDKHSLSWVIKVIINSDVIWWVSTLDTMGWEWHLTPAILLPLIHHLILIVRKTPHKSQRRNILQNAWLVLLTTVWVTQDKESLRSCHSREETKETRQMNVCGVLDGIQEHEIDTR